MTAQPTCCATCPYAPARNTLDLLRARCLELGAFVTWDSRVSEETAAALLVVALGTIRNRASSDPVLPFVKVGNRRTYRLVDIAAVLDSR